MKLKFDRSQKHQEEAVQAVVDLFAGQPRRPPQESVIDLGRFAGTLDGVARTELGLGNVLHISDDRLLANVRSVQRRNGLAVPSEAVPLEAWDVAGEDGASRRCAHFSVEMETGTGKTYTYLRTLLELNRVYGFSKFVIVVPTVAIREGTLKSIEMTAEHFRDLYRSQTFEHSLYDAKRPEGLRHFAIADGVQVLIITIDSFNKSVGSGEGRGAQGNVIHREEDRLHGRAPIEYLRAVNPIVMIDEPQSVDNTPKAQAAISSLNPLFTLRYSATHRNPYNLVYRLDAIRAFELRLVKRIVVANATTSGRTAGAPVKLEEVRDGRTFRARVRLLSRTKRGPKAKTVTVTLGSDLFTLSGRRECYREGYVVTHISRQAGDAHVAFANGLRLALGEEVGGGEAEIWRSQIELTVRQHLEKELQLQALGIKVLSLFFIGQVDSYRGRDSDGRPILGKFGVAFEECFALLARNPRYAGLACMKHPIGKLHDGYFAQDRRIHTPFEERDVKGSNAEERERTAYALIMQEKERLLQEDEPLRFIFSHSALREGWDNPNVFQICTLGHAAGVIRKRQEIGRGLRLAVDRDGARVHDERVNRLWVMANESYEDFAQSLQSEYEEDCGVTFGRIPLSALADILVPREGSDPELTIGVGAAASLFAALVAQGLIDSDGRVLPAFAPERPGFSLAIPDQFGPIGPAVIAVMREFRLERFVGRERDELDEPATRDLATDGEVIALWDRISPRTSYRVEFSTSTLVERASAAVHRMRAIAAPHLRLTAGEMMVSRKGVETRSVEARREDLPVRYGRGGQPLPDILTHLQAETGLTRATLARVLLESGRLGDCFVDPHAFLDEVAMNVKRVLRELMVEGVSYERITSGDHEPNWDRELLRRPGAIDGLGAVAVGKSIYRHIVVDSEIERRFAEVLDERDDIRLLIKLPRTFAIDTPVGSYNPDWAIAKIDDREPYLVVETKGSADPADLRSDEAAKIWCGARHFSALNVKFMVATEAGEV